MLYERQHETWLRLAVKFIDCQAFPDRVAFLKLNYFPLCLFPRNIPQRKHSTKEGKHQLQSLLM